MKTTAPLQKEIPKTTITTAEDKATQNPLQLKKEVEKAPVQKKQNPLPVTAGNQNPLQFRSANNIDTNSNTPLQLEKNNTGLPDNLKAGVEALSGYSMDDVKVHYNSNKPAQLQALAYAQGIDIHIAPGQEQHLPHEAWHVVQQKQGRVKATMQMKGGIDINDDKGLEKEADEIGDILRFKQYPLQKENGQILNKATFASVIRINNHQKKGKATAQLFFNTIQCVYSPAVLTEKAHLRSIKDRKVLPIKKAGRTLKKNDVIVVDFDNEKTLNGDTWLPAYDIAPDKWKDRSTLPSRYIRLTKVKKKIYPSYTDVEISKRQWKGVEEVWNDTFGEYTVLEPSVLGENRQLIAVGKLLHSLKDNNVKELDNLEFYQIDTIGEIVKTSMKRLQNILTEAASVLNIKTEILATDKNTNSLASILRFNKVYDDKNKWHKWSEGVFKRIRTGAYQLANAINYWQDELSIKNARCTIKSIQLTGSDLHDTGLGVAILDINKPAKTSLFYGKTDMKLVIKPEDRNIEKSLFGKHPESLAGIINKNANLSPKETITQIEMETHKNYGSIIEFLEGMSAKHIKRTGKGTQAMTEGLAFVLLTGISDAHEENVLWKDGKPCFIDVDNALSSTVFSKVPSQSGFSSNDPAWNEKELKYLRGDIQHSESKIIQSLLKNAIPFLKAIRKAFVGKTGRIVPRATNYWARSLEEYITAPDEGESSKQRTRTEMLKNIAENLPEILSDNQGYGLIGEAGVASSGKKYTEKVEGTLIQQDFDQGRIPFYHYYYTEGFVYHNNNKIWNGQSLADAMKTLELKFKKT